MRNWIIESSQKVPWNGKGFEFNSKVSFDPQSSVFGMILFVLDV